MPRGSGGTHSGSSHSSHTSSSRSSSSFSSHSGRTSIGSSPSRSGGFGGGGRGGGFGRAPRPSAPRPPMGGGYPPPPRHYAPGPPPPPPPPRPRRHWFHRGPTYVSYGRPSYGGGIGTVLALIVLLFIVVAIANAFTSAASKRQREEPPAYAYEHNEAYGYSEDAPTVTNDSLYLDMTGTVTRGSEIESGLKYFVEKTGYTPFVYLTTDEIKNIDTHQLYKSLFSDEDHILVVLSLDLYNGEWDSFDTYYEIGTNAYSVFNQRVEQRFNDAFDTAWDNDSNTNEQVISEAFRVTADSIR